MVVWFHKNVVFQMKLEGLKQLTDLNFGCKVASYVSSDLFDGDSSPAEISYASLVELDELEKDVFLVLEQMMD